MNLHLLGRVELIDNEGKSIQLHTKKVFLLLAILALHQDQKLSRNYLAEQLWPGKAVESSRQNLRNALSSLKKALPANAVKADGESILLKSGYLWCDANATQDLSDYAGDFMPDYTEDWVVDQRLKLRGDAVRKAIADAKNLINSDSQAALRIIERGCEIDPLDQEAAQLKVNILEQQGNLTEAVQVADSFKNKVLRDLGFLCTLETTPRPADTNPLLETAHWLLEKNPEEAVSFLAATRYSWFAMGGKMALDVHEQALNTVGVDSHSRKRVEAQRLYLRWVVGQLNQDYSQLRRAFEDALVNKESDTASTLGAVMSFNLLSQGQFGLSLKLARQTFESNDFSQNPIEKLRAERNLAIIELHVGNYSQWASRVKQNHAPTMESGSVEEVASQNLVITGVWINEGHPDKAALSLAKARRYYESSDGRRMVGFTLLCEAEIHECLGDNAQALKIADSVRDLGEGTIGHSLAACVEDLVARQYTKLGNYDFGAEAVARGVLLRRKLGSKASIYERRQMMPTRLMLKEHLNEQDIRDAFARAKLQTAS